MSDCSDKHSIQLSNINNNATITYPLVQLKGQITNLCRYSDISIVNNTNNFCATFIVSKVNKQFKCLVSLEPGSNSITLKYCTSQESVTINYVKNSSGGYTVKPLYILCTGHDGHFQSPFQPNSMDVACTKITLALKLVQCLFAEKLHEKQLGRKTFQLQSECIPFYSKLSVKEAQQLDQHKLWHYFGREIIASDLGTEKRWKFVAFIGCTTFLGIPDGNYSYENVKAHTVANAALGAGDFALFGTGCLYTWPSLIVDVIQCFQNEQVVDGHNYLDDSNNRHTFGGCFATSLGSLCHEVGHIFDLGHTTTGIMGNGFDFVNRVFVIDNITEILPDRIVGQECDTGTTAQRTDSRLTNVKKSNQFLVKYQEQRNNDLTFFAENSAIVLAHHKWLNSGEEESAGNENKFYFDQRRVTTEMIPLCLIELREKATALAKEFYVLDGEPCYKFEIPKSVSLDAVDVFCMDTSGNIQCF